jgi:hypothetical protein
MKPMRIIEIGQLGRGDPAESAYQTRLQPAVFDPRAEVNLYRRAKAPRLI